MNESINNETPTDTLAPYLYFQKQGVNSFEDLEQFKKDFPDCHGTLIVVVFRRLVYQNHGVRVLGF